MIAPLIRTRRGTRTLRARDVSHSARASRPRVHERLDDDDRCLRGAPEPAVRGGLPDAGHGGRRRGRRAGRVAALVGGDRSEVADPKAYLVRITTNVALDRLRSARARRETYVGPWLPEPMLTSPDIAEDAELSESVSMAMLVVLETLSPLERAVFVLKEVFGYPYAEIARALDRSETSVRQLGTRARKHVEARRPRFEAGGARARRDRAVPRRGPRRRHQPAHGGPRPRRRAVVGRRRQGPRAAPGDLRQRKRVGRFLAGISGVTYEGVAMRRHALRARRGQRR